MAKLEAMEMAKPSSSMGFRGSWQGMYAFFAAVGRLGRFCVVDFRCRVRWLMAEGSAIGRNCASSSLSLRSLNLAYSKPSRSMPLLQHPHLRRGAKYRLSNRQPAQFTFVCDGYLSLCALRITLDKRDKQVARVRIGRRDLSAEPCPRSGRALPRRPSDRNRVRALRCFAVVGRPIAAESSVADHHRLVEALTDGARVGPPVLVTGTPWRDWYLAVAPAGALVQPATHNRPVPALRGL